MQEKDIVLLLQRIPDFLEKAIITIIEGEDMIEEGLMPVSTLNYLKGYLKGGLDIIKIYLEQIDE